MRYSRLEVLYRERIEEKEEIRKAIRSKMEI